MPFSNCQIAIRKLSVQVEENGVEDDSDVPANPFPYEYNNRTEHYSGSSAQTDVNELVRKLSMTSSKSSSSLASSSSAPGIMSSNGASHAKQLECFGLKPTGRKIMTSRPSFISLCSIVSETADESMQPRYLPAPLQVEFDLMQRAGLEGDEPKCRSHLPILRSPSDYDINLIEPPANVASSGSRGIIRNHSHHGLMYDIKHIPDAFRKLSTDKHRFNVYSISDETREELKHLYVY